MVDITIDNLEEKFDEINTSLQKANFIAIDSEFTGLHLENYEPSFKDSANERYKKLATSVQKFNIVQVGLSAFRYCSVEKTYFVDTYNFFLFPRNFGLEEFNQTFSHQISCIEFLIKHNFDFNTLFYKGISCLNQRQEKQLKSILQNKGLLADNEDAAAATEKFLGFNKIFDLLVEYKKPLITHNGFMDLLYFYEKFYDTLPDTIEEFKKSINELFPVIYDTKHISTECRKRIKEMKEICNCTVLETIDKSLSCELEKNVFFNIPRIKHVKGNYDSKLSPHEAGYDAFICGSVFLKLGYILINRETKKCYNTNSLSINDYFYVMKQFENKVHILEASLNYINLAGMDPAEAKTIVLYVKSKKQITVYELVNLFSTYGNCEVTLKSKTTAFVNLNSTFNAKKIISAFESQKDLEVNLYKLWDQKTLIKPIIGTCIIASGVFVYWFIRK